MKVLIVSDTHGRDENLEEAVLREAPFDYLCKNSTWNNGRPYWLRREG